MPLGTCPKVAFFYQFCSCLPYVVTENLVGVYGGVVNFESGSFKVLFDRFVEFLGVKGGDFTNGLGQIMVPDFSIQDVLNEANSKGVIEIATSIAFSLSGNAYLSGSGEILKFRSAFGQSFLEFKEVELRNCSGNKVQVNEPVGGIINKK